jgi:acetyl esterase
VSSLHPKIKEFLDTLAAEGGKAAELSTPSEVRANALSKWRPEFLGNVPKTGSIKQRYFTGPHADLPINIYTPVGEGPFPAIVYFHGGGWVAGTIEMTEVQHQLVGEACGAVVVSVNYQKAPEHKFPIPFDDCYSALEWTFNNSVELSIDIEKIGIGGDSAGGNLASGVAIKARDRGKFDVAYQLLIYPANSPSFVSTPDVPNATGFGSTQAGIKWAWEQYLDNDSNLVNPYAVPHSAKDLSDLPPTILITAEFDVLREDGKEYARKLELSGNSVSYKDFPGMIHGFFNYKKYIDDAMALREYIAENVLKILKVVKP